MLLGTKKVFAPLATTITFIPVARTVFVLILSNHVLTYTIGKVILKKQEELFFLILS